MTNILCIGDPHSTVDHPNDRFELAGKYILETKPDIIVCLGDFASMDSLSNFDKGKRCFEGRRVKKDIAAAIDANEKLWAEVNNYNDMRRKNRDKQYKPRKVMTLGNHEFRVERAIEVDPELEGLISIADLQYERFGWEVVDYNVPIFIEGIAFAHTFPTGVSGQPISGINIARALLQKNYQSSVVGHNHLRDFYADTRADGKRILGLSAGCFTDEVPGYALATARLWWAGLVMLQDVRDGDYEPSFISLDMLDKKYRKAKK